jgi:two-component system chemotaxis response regulator CheB
MPFGRSAPGSPAGDLTDLGCPDCRGVLAVREEGARRHLAFSCRVGHGYSGESLIAGKEEQLESSLWSAVEVYEEIVLLHDEMATRARADGVRELADAFQDRAERARVLMADLRQIIARDSVAAPARGKAPK